MGAPEVHTLATLGTSGLPEDRDPNTWNSAGEQVDPTTFSRRSLREAEQAVARRSAPRRVAVPTPAPAAPVKRRRGLRGLAVMAIAGGIVATIAIPAYAFNPANANQASFGTSAIDNFKKVNSQTVAVSGVVDAPVAAGDKFSATTEAQLAAKKAAAAEAKAAAAMEAYGASYTGPSASDYLANPPYPNFSLAKVFSVAEQYIGVPYVYGGDSPAGFDCSGYVSFVYAQFGISMPHSATAISSMGTRISLADAQPGDVIAMGSHVGFYAGNGNILDAPDVGRNISIRPLWTNDFWVERFGI